MAVRGVRSLADRQRRPVPPLTPPPDARSLQGTRARALLGMTSLYDHLDRPSLKTFVQTVSRAFYEPSHVILLDQLLKRDACVPPSLAASSPSPLGGVADLSKGRRFREDDLAALTGVNTKDLARLAGPLIGDGLVMRCVHLLLTLADRPGLTDLLLASSGSSTRRPTRRRTRGRSTGDTIGSTSSASRTSSAGEWTSSSTRSIRSCGRCVAFWIRPPLCVHLARRAELA
jgi:hypothetical protein